MDKTKKHFFLIDSFRGIASVWLAAFHILPSYLSESGWLLSLIEFGRIGTDFFFVASGFVSAIACYKILNSYQNSEFTLKRMKKIYSLYLYSLTLALFIVPFLISLVSFLKSQELVFEFNIPTLYELFLYVSLLKVFTSETWSLYQAFVNINGVYWFIAIMVQIYLFLGIALRFKQGFYIILTSAFFLSLLCLVESFRQHLPVGLFLPHFSKFFIGMALYFFILKRPIHQKNLVTSVLVVTCISLLGLVIYLHINEFKGYSFRLLSALTVAFFLYLLYPLDSLIKNSIAGKATLWLGRFSFSTYLNHVIFWPFIYMFVSNLIPLPLSITAPLVLLPLVILCCFTSHKFFDNPGLSYYLKHLKRFFFAGLDRISSLRP